MTPYIVRLGERRVDPWLDPDAVVAGAPESERRHALLSRQVQKLLQALLGTAQDGARGASDRAGLAKLRQLVTASGRAPVTATLRAASATACWAPPLHGRVVTTRCDVVGSRVDTR